MLIEEHRKRIQTAALINRLQSHCLGKIEMQPTQIRAIEILLKKALPDLATITHQGSDDGGPILIATGVLRTEDDAAGN